MLVYLFISFIFYVVFGLVKSKHKLKGVSFLFLLLLFLLGVVRDIGVGTDYYTYKQVYDSGLSFTFQNSYSRVVNLFDASEISGVHQRFEPFFVLLYSVFFSVGFSFSVVNAFVLALALYIFYNVSRKFEASTPYVLLLFFMCYWYFVFFNTTRQGVAMLFTVCAYIGYRKSFIHFFFFGLVAFLTHFSSIIFIPLIPFARHFKVLGRFRYLLVLGSALIGLTISSMDFGTVFSIYNYVTSASLSKVSFLYSSLYNVGLIAVYITYSILNKRNHFDEIESFWLLGLIINNLTWNFPIVQRSAEYFLFYQVFVLPRALVSVSSRRIVFFVVAVFFVYNLLLNRQGVVPFNI